jgi:hypothetical protein
LFAALDVATGTVTDACYPRHRHGEFLRFLEKVTAACPGCELRVVCDNYATHKHAEVRNWLARPENQRVRLHFLPTSCSWLNLVECFFSVITPPGHPTRQLHLGQGTHRRHRRVHRPLERTPPAIHLDQRHRRDPRQDRPREG